MSCENLMQRVWGQANSRGSRVIRTHLMRLGSKLGEEADNPIYILIFAEPSVRCRMAEGESPAP